MASEGVASKLEAVRRQLLGTKVTQRKVCGQLDSTRSRCLGRGPGMPGTACWPAGSLPDHVCGIASALTACWCCRRGTSRCHCCWTARLPCRYLMQRLLCSEARTGPQVWRSHLPVAVWLTAATDQLSAADNSWPAFCKALLSFARNTTKQQVDLGVTRTLRKLVQVAEEPRAGKCSRRPATAQPWEHCA